MCMLNREKKIGCECNFCNVNTGCYKINCEPNIQVSFISVFLVNKALVSQFSYVKFTYAFHVPCLDEPNTTEIHIMVNSESDLSMN